MLDRTKEPGAIGEPLYQDVVTALAEASATAGATSPRMPRSIGGRYGLSSKEFTPAMVEGGVRRARPRRAAHALHGRHRRRRDAHRACRSTRTSTSKPDDVVRAVFYGLGSDGTVGANKNSIKIIGEDTRPVRAGLLRVRLEEVRRDDRLAPAVRPAPDPVDLSDPAAGFVPATSSTASSAIDVLGVAAPGATFLLNSPYGPDEVWDHLPLGVQQADRR